MFHQNLISRGGYISSKKSLETKLHTLLLKTEGNHLRCKTANKRLKVRERVEIPEENKYGPLASPAFLRRVSVSERNLD